MRKRRLQQAKQSQDRARPRYPHALTRPEDTECLKHHADTKLQGILRNLGERLSQQQPDCEYHQTRSERSQGSGKQQATPSTNGYDDKNHLKAFEKNSLEGRQPCDPREGFTPGSGRQPSGFRFKNGVLIMQRDDVGTPQDSLPQPPHAEQQEENTDDKLQNLKRDKTYQRAEDSDQQAKDDKGGHCTD